MFPGNLEGGSMRGRYLGGLAAAALSRRPALFSFGRSRRRADARQHLRPQPIPAKLDFSSGHGRTGLASPLQGQVILITLATWWTAVRDPVSRRSCDSTRTGTRHPVFRPLSRRAAHTVRAALIDEFLYSSRQGRDDFLRALRPMWGFPSRMITAPTICKRHIGMALRSNSAGDKALL